MPFVFNCQFAKIVDAKSYTNQPTNELNIYTEGHREGL